MKPLGDAFIALIKMMIAPVIFCTVVHGIGSMRDLSKVGRVGVKTLLYFEVVSTIALAIGLIVGKRAPARHRLQHRSGDARSQGGGELRHRGQAGRRRRPSVGDHPGQLLRRAGPRRHPASAAGIHSLRLRDRAIGRGRREDQLRDRLRRQDVLRHHPHHRARGADRRVRRHGVHHRRLWARLADQPLAAGRDVLPDQRPVRAGACSAPSPISPASRSCASSATSRTNC